MNWKNLFIPVKSVTADKVREHIKNNTSGTYQLLDVRQPREYSAGHLAGAVLIPLKELPGRLTELDSSIPTFVYCAIGGRSRAAAQFLSGQGFSTVFNMSGGIKAWEGRQAEGPEHDGMRLFHPDMNFADAISLAYAMEDGLQIFYQHLAHETTDAPRKKLFKLLAGFESHHKIRLQEEYRRERGKEAELRTDNTGIMEGGINIDNFIKRLPSPTQSLSEILDLSMGLETQALDLYSRMAAKSNEPETAKFFQRIAVEEQNHLALLADEMDNM
ncbi:rhodanese-like domain-containing protein [Desulfobacterota bacterium M19]